MEKTQNQNEISAQAIDPTHVLAMDHPPAHFGLQFVSSRAPICPAKATVRLSCVVRLLGAPAAPLAIMGLQMFMAPFRYLTTAQNG